MTTEEQPLTATEIAILELTNSLDDLNPQEVEPKPLILTTKEMYLWGAAIVTLIEADPSLTEDLFNATLRGVFQRNQEEIKRYYDKANPLRPPFQDQLFQTLVQELSKQLHIPLDYQKVADSAQAAYQSLARKQLIEDPIELLLPSGITLAVLGVLPVGFTMTTAEGHIQKLEYRSVLLDVKYARDKSKRHIGIDFRLLRYLNVFKGALIESFKTMLSEEKNSDSNHSIKQKKRNIKAKGPKKGGNK